MELEKPVEVSVVIPAYNEEEGVRRVIQDVKKAMKETRFSYEVLVVDDGSQDRTCERSRAEGARVIERPVRGGSGASRRTGVLNAKGEIIVMIDGDGSYEAADIPKLLEFFPEYDQVNGARTSERGSLRFLRIPTKWLIQKLACYLTRTSIPDLNTGLKAFKKEVMLKYLWSLPDGFSCVSTMTLAFLANGHPVKYVATPYYRRLGRSKFRPVQDTLAYFNTVIRMVMYFKPLRVFMPLCFSLVTLGILKGIWSFKATGTLQESDVIILMTGIVVGVLGLLADLIVAYQNK